MMFFNNLIKNKKEIKYKLLLKMYSRKPFKRMFYNLIDKYEGGKINSESLRRIFNEKHNIIIGYASYGCFNPNINYGEPISIGNYCSFADNVQFVPGNHPSNLVSTHPFFFQSGFGYVKDLCGKPEPTIVGNDVWIGRDTIFLPKCKRIGNGAIIGAGSVVTCDVEPYSIVAGNPARLIRKRFDDETILRLEESKWFLFPPKELSKAIQYANDFEKFLSEVQRIKKENKE